MERFWWHHPEVVRLEVEETSPQEILETIKEMLARLEDNFKYFPEEEKLRQAYHKLWSESGFQGSPNKTPIGIAWLNKTGIYISRPCLHKQDRWNVQASVVDLVSFIVLVDDYRDIKS